MNIYFWEKDELKKEIIKELEKDNEVFYNTKKLKFFELLKLKKEKDIQIVIMKKENQFFQKLIKNFIGIPTCVLKENEDNLEKKLQNIIAYNKQKDLPVLMYHRVISSEEEKGYYDTYVTTENFEKQMKYLKENNYQIITFKDLENGEYKRRFDRDKKYVIITFDDGYKDNYINALPILKKYDIRIVLYLVTDLKYNKWDTDVNDRPKEKKFELMNLQEVKELLDSGLVEIGGHTTVHLDMPVCEEKFLKEDLKKSKEKLEKISGQKIVSFAYPWGRNNENIRKLVKEVGYKFAVSTESGSSCFSDDLFEIQRVGIYSKDDIEKFKKKISGNYPFMRENRRKMKELRNKIRKKLGLKTK